MQGLLIVVSGFSGVGKGTLTKELLKRYPEEYAFSVSATSRSPRPGEVDGREYFFVTREKFQEMIENDELIERACYSGNYYGTPKQYVLDRMAEGKNVILEIDVQGGFQIKKKFPSTYLLFVLPPSAEELEKRLRNRGTESEEDIRKRLERSLEEADFISDYDDTLTNGDFEESFNRLHEMIMAEKEKLNREMLFAEEFKNTMAGIISREEN